MLAVPLLMDISKSLRQRGTNLEALLQGMLTQLMRRSVQEQIAENIPVSRWGPNTQQALLAAGYQPMPGETLGQMLQRYGENPADTVAADGATFGSNGNSADDFLSGDTSGLEGYNTSGTFNNLPDDTFDPNGSDLGLSSTDLGNSLDWNDLPDNTFDNSASTFTGSPADMTGIGSGGTVGTQGTAGTFGGGAPIDITDLPGADTAIKGAGTAVQGGLTGAANAVAGTFANGLNALQTYTSEAFVYIALIILGVIFVAFGLSMFGKREDIIPVGI